MDTLENRYIKALKDSNKSLATGLETALIVMDKWDNISDQNREEIITRLKILLKNNGECFTKTDSRTKVTNLRSLRY